MTKVQILKWRWNRIKHKNKPNFFFSFFAHPHPTINFRCKCLFTRLCQNGCIPKSCWLLLSEYSIALYEINKWMKMKERMKQTNQGKSEIKKSWKRFPTESPMIFRISILQNWNQGILYIINYSDFVVEEIENEERLIIVIAFFMQIHSSFIPSSIYSTTRAWNN